MSLDVGEPLFGSAVGGVERWLLIEHDGVWAPDAIASEGLPAPLVGAVRAWLAGGPGRRLQLIRRPRAATSREAESVLRRFFLVDAREGRESISTATIDDAVWATDATAHFPDATDVETPAGWEAFGQRLVLVCTHGRRDACCARLGVPIFNDLNDELSEDAPGIVWHTSHVGGHRFAANIVLLPHGYHYGRLDAPVARRIVRGYLRGRLTDLDRLRGRSSWTPEVQAADYWYRQATGQCAIDGVRLVRLSSMPDGGVAVTLRDTASDEVHELHVTREKTSDLAPASCGDTPVAVIRHRLDSLRRLAGAEIGEHHQHHPS
jgi:hypothetical protein